MGLRSNVIGIGLFFFVIPFSAHSGIFGPSNLEECIADGKVGRTPDELYHHENSCQAKFPKVPSIFDGSNKFVICRYRVDPRIGFDISVNQKTRIASIKNYPGFDVGKVSSISREKVILTFFRDGDRNKEMMFLQINNIGVFWIKNNEGSWEGDCSEQN